MVASAAVTGFGATFAYESGLGVFTTLGEVVSITPPNWTRETVDVTHMASDSGYREFIGSLCDGGESTVTMNYVEAGMTLLHTLLDAGVETFRIVIPGASTVTFTAIPTGVTVDDLVVDDKVTMSMTMKVTGKPTFLAA